MEGAGQEARASDAGHVPVLLREVMALLEPRAGEVAVDCTAGCGGHALALAAAVGPQGLLVEFEVDDAALDFAARRAREAGCRFEAVGESFVHAPAWLASRGLRAGVVLADLGFSSAQMDDPRRGFSFAADGPLDMRFDRRREVTAADLLARLSERELAEVIFRCGEEPYARRIARAIASARRRQPLRTTGQLAQVVREAYGRRARFSRMHPATRTFMALRIAVNGEIEALEALLEHVARGAEEAPSGGWLNPDARIAVISFHSLEDRLVKLAFAGLEARGLARRITRRPVTAGADEVAANPRARSAKLRVLALAPGGA